MILILSSQRDIHAQSVIKELNASNTPNCLIDLSLYPTKYGSTFLFKYNSSKPDFKLQVDQHRSIDLDQVKSVWWRRPQSFVLHEDIKKPSHQHFAFNECKEAISGLWYSLDCKWVNDPAKDEIAHRKLYQLKLAKKIGLTIPETCISNIEYDVSAFINEQKREAVICKSFSATEQEWRETRLVKNEEQTKLSSVKYAPVIFQEYIDAVYDIRVTVVGNNIFPAAIYSQETSYKVDCRMDIGRAQIEAVELPEEVNQKLLRLMNELDLTYGAIDLRLTPNNEYVFLEINPAGQWLFIEEKTKQPITKAVADSLNV